MFKLISFLLSVFLIFSNFAFGGIDEFDLSNPLFDLDQFKGGGPSKDGIPAIDRGDFVKAREAAFLKNSDMVIGVKFNNKAKAYPLKILNWHEVVNDSIEDNIYSVSWCPLTRSAIVFDRKVGNEELSFGVSGLLYNSNLVLYDRNSNSLWPQLFESGASGKFSNKSLNKVPAILSTWESWRKLYPQTTVLSLDTGYRRDYDRDPYYAYQNDPDIFFPLLIDDRRLELKELVIGIKIDNTAKAYPLKIIKELDLPINDKIAGKTVLIHKLDSKSFYITDKDNNLLPAVTMYWFAWSNFNQDSLLYSG